MELILLFLCGYRRYNMLLLVLLGCLMLGQSILRRG